MKGVRMLRVGLCIDLSKCDRSCDSAAYIDERRSKLVRIFRHNTTTQIAGSRASIYASVTHLLLR